MGSVAVPPCHVVAVPFPGRGHVNAMLSLCRLLAARGVATTVILTEEWVGLVGASESTLPARVRLTAIPNVIPSEHGRAAAVAAGGAPHRLPDRHVLRPQLVVLLPQQRVLVPLDLRLQPTQPDTITKKEEGIDSSWPSLSHQPTRCTKDT